MIVCLQTEKTCSTTFGRSQSFGEPSFTEAPTAKCTTELKNAPVSNGEETLLRVEKEKSGSTDEAASRSDQDDSAASDSDEVMSSYLPSFFRTRKVVKKKMISCQTVDF